MGFGPKLPVVGSATNFWASTTVTVLLPGCVEKMFSCARSGEEASRSEANADVTTFIYLYTPSRPGLLRSSRRQRQNRRPLHPAAHGTLIHELIERHIPGVRIPRLAVEPALVQLVLVPAPEIHEVVAVRDQAEVAQLVAEVVRHVLAEEVAVHLRRVVAPGSRRRP